MHHTECIAYISVKLADYVCFLQESWGGPSLPCLLPDLTPRCFSSCSRRNDPHNGDKNQSVVQSSVPRSLIHSLAPLPAWVESQDDDHAAFFCVRMSDVRQTGEVRGLPSSTSAESLGFWTPSPSCPQIHTTSLTNIFYYIRF